MDPVLERRMEQFQNKVQQHINLADDEIDRLTSYLTTIKGDILESNDQLNRLQLRLVQSAQEISGNNKRQQAELNTKISKMKTIFNIKLQEIQAAQAQELYALQQNYQDSLNNIHNSIKDKVSQQTAPVEDLIKSTKAKLQAMQSTFGNSERVNDEAAIEDIKAIHDLALAQQKQLEKAIQSRTQERLESMINAKSRLSDCVATLDEMERNHAGQMNNFKLKLEQIDNQYQMRKKNEMDKHNSCVNTLKRKLDDYEKKMFALQRTIHKIEHHHKLQLDTAVREGDELQFSMKTQEMQTQLSLKESEKIKRLVGQLQQLKLKLEKRENELHGERTDNESLKREINRLRHEAQMSKRRQARATVSQL